MLFGEIKPGTIIRNSGVTYVKIRPHYFNGCLINAINRWGSRVEFAKDEEVTIVGDLGDYNEPKVSNTP